MSTRRSGRGAKLRTIAILAGGVLGAALLFPTLGAQAISGDYMVVVSAPHSLSPSGTPGATQGGNATCPPGFVATGGGVDLTQPENASLRLINSAPYPLGPNPGAWVANMVNESTTTAGGFVITVVCFGK